MKRALAILLTLLLITASTAFAGNEKLTFSYWGSGLEKESIEAALHDFTEETGVEVEPLHIPENYQTKLTTMAAAGTMPDAGYMDESNTIGWAINGMIDNLNDIYASDTFSARMESNIFRLDNGDIVGISLANETIVMFYNKAVFDAAGIAYPPATADAAWTWDQFIDVCQQLTVDANGNHPNEAGFDAANIVTYGARIGKASHLLEPLFRSNEGGIYSEDYKSIILDSPETLEVIDALGDMINVQHVHPSPDQAATVPSMSAAFLSNRLAMQIDGQWSLQDLAYSAKEDGTQFGIAVLPKFKKAVTGNTGGPIVLFKDSEHREDAVQLIQFILNPEKVLGLINSGLWQPTEQQWYTDESLIGRWMVEGVHPPEYRTAVIEYTLSSMINNSFFHVPTVAKVNDIYTPALDPVWAGTATAEEAIGSV
ncbi:MAG: sugar ABC transporter substrate-binding protein, partial [Rhodopirellula sp.]|nr:sugar ABC transporter substrate-binding protein [Rhodopirellula sp.]